MDTDIDDLDEILELLEKKERIGNRISSRASSSEDSQIRKISERRKKKLDEEIYGDNLGPIVDQVDLTETPVVIPKPKPIFVSSSSPLQVPYDLEAIFDQMKQVITTGKEDFTTKNGFSALSDRESEIEDMVKRSAMYGHRYDSHHHASCCATECDILRLEVRLYEKSRHICAQVGSTRLCDQMREISKHSGNFISDSENFYLCENSANVHECGDMCTTSKHLSNQSMEYVCPISGRVLGVQMKGEWFLDKENPGAYHADDTNFENTEHQIHVVKVSKEGGESKITYGTQRVEFKTHPNYNHHPFEPKKTYMHYLMRSKIILWYLFYSNNRFKIEEERLKTSLNSMMKEQDKYIKGCKRQGVPKCYQILCSNMRAHIKMKSDVAIWVPPFRIMEKLLLHYAQMIVKFFWIILTKTQFGAENHTSLPFDYFSLATIDMMRNRGLVVGEHVIVPQDAYISTHMPDYSLFVKLGIHQGRITKTDTHIRKAIRDLDPEKLRVTITDQDPVLFYESAQRWFAVSYPEILNKKRQKGTRKRKGDGNENKRVKRKT